HDVINWFETKPLFGKRIVVTRAREQASELRKLLEDAGANVIEFPTIEIVPPESYASLDRAVTGDFDFIIFTSVNGVRAYFARLAPPRCRRTPRRRLSHARSCRRSRAARERRRGHVQQCIDGRQLLPRSRRITARGRREARLDRADHERRHSQVGTRCRCGGGK